MSTRIKLLHLVSLLVMLFPLALGAQAPTKSPFEISDYYRTAFVGAPALSPSGENVAFTVRHYDLEGVTSWSEIWMMGPDGSRLRQMTAGRHNDGAPVFSPDGKSILFTSNRSGGASQLYLLPIDGGEARQLTRFPLDLSEPSWSPDGRWIAVTAEVFPECGADAECNGKIQSALEEGKLKVHVADSLLYRHWTSWRDGKYAHILLVDPTNGEVVKDLTPGNWDSPTFSLSGDRGFDFSPDGRELCYVSNHEPDPASSTNADLWTVRVEEEITPESAVNLTAANKGWDGAPLYSPDGRFIAYRSQAKPGYESDLFRIAIYERNTGTVRYLTDRTNFDNWVNEIAWTPASDALYFQAEFQGRNPLYRIGLDSSKIERLLTDGTIDGWRFFSNGKSVIYSRRTVGDPPEIFRASLPAGNSERLTRFNADLEASVDIRPVEEIWIQGDGDYKVQVFIVKPHGFDPSQKYPLILNVHGGPQSQWMDSYRGDWQVYPGKGYVVAFPNPTGSTGFGQDYTDAIAEDWGGRVFRDLMKVTDALEELPYVDRENIGAMGWSYGGYMMMWFEGHTKRFKTIASMMGVYNLVAMYGSTEEIWFPEHDLGGPPWESELYAKWSPSEYAARFETPCLVVTGELDYRVPYTQSLEFFTALQKQDVPSRLVVFPGAGHWPNWYEMAFYYNVHLDWFHRWLGGEPAPYDVIKFARNQVFREASGPSKE